MSEKKMNESEANVRHTFLAKLTPGPANEVVVFADNFTQAIELLASRFGKWKTFSMRQLEDEEIIGSAPDDPSALPSADTMRLRSCLSYIRQVAFGENPHIAPGIIPDYAEEELQSVVRLRANYDRRVKEVERITNEVKELTEGRDFLCRLLKNCRKVAMGEAVEEPDTMTPFTSWDDSIKLVEATEALKAVRELRISEARKAQTIHTLYEQVDTLQGDIEFCRCIAAGETTAWRKGEPKPAALDAVIRLREKLETFKATAFHPAPPGPVPTAPPASVAEQNQLRRLEEKYKRQVQAAFQFVQQRNFLYELLENCCRAALGKPIKEIAPDEPWDDHAKFAEMKAALDAVIGLRGRFEALNEQWREAVDSPPGTPLYQPELEPFPSSPVVAPLMPEKIGTVPDGFGTADATAMTGPGKPAEATGTGDAEEDPEE